MAQGFKTGGLLPIGTPSKATAEVRACVARIAQNLAPQVEEWIVRGAVDDPLGAAKVVTQLLEYHVPKLARIECSSESPVRSLSDEELDQRIAQLLSGTARNSRCSIPCPTAAR